MGRATKSKTVDLKRCRAYELKLKGMSYNQIANELSVSATMAHKYVKQWIESLRTYHAETVEEQVQIEISRLDRIIEQCEIKLAEQWTSRDAEILLKVSNRRASLLGLDKRQEVSFSLVEKLSDGELKSRVDDILTRQKASQVPTEH